MDRAHNLAREIRALRSLMMTTAKAVNPSAGVSELLKALDGLSMALLRLSAVIKQQVMIMGGVAVKDREGVISEYLAGISGEVLARLQEDARNGEGLPPGFDDLDDPRR